MTQVFKNRNHSTYVNALILDMLLLGALAVVMGWMFGFKESIEWVNSHWLQYWYACFTIAAWAIVVATSYIRGLTYRIKIFDDGTVAESQWFSKKRKITVKDIFKIGRRKYVHESRYISFFLWGWKVKGIAGDIMGPTLLNNVCKNFPKHAVDESIINIIQNMRPGIPADHQSVYKI